MLVDGPETPCVHPKEPPKIRHTTAHRPVLNHEGRTRGRERDRGSQRERVCPRRCVKEKGRTRVSMRAYVRYTAMRGTGEIRERGGPDRSSRAKGSRDGRRPPSQDRAPSPPPRPGPRPTRQSAPVQPAAAAAAAAPMSRRRMVGLDHLPHDVLENLGHLRGKQRQTGQSRPWTRARGRSRWDEKAQDERGTRTLISFRALVS